MSEQTVEEPLTGWQLRHEELHKNYATEPMIGPWHWEVHDYSAATLCGGGEDAIVGHIMHVSPCPACAENANPKEWAWGRCGTPSLPNARLIAFAPDLLEYVKSSASNGCAEANRLIAKLAIHI